jgi:hypothetical protein
LIEKTRKTSYDLFYFVFFRYIIYPNHVLSGCVDVALQNSRPSAFRFAYPQAANADRWEEHMHLVRLPFKSDVELEEWLILVWLDLEQFGIPSPKLSFSTRRDGQQLLELRFSTIDHARALSRLQRLTASQRRSARPCNPGLPELPMVGTKFPIARRRHKGWLRRVGL